MSKPSKIQKGDPETTGHIWDGIKEFNNPLPRWWLWTFYLTIIWAIGYTVLYPAWPMLNGATPGILGWSSRAEVQADIDAVNEANAAINTRLAKAELTDVAADNEKKTDAEKELNTYAVSAGNAVFKTWCAQCHGSGAAGAKGYPNLLDDSWLWGGDIEAIYATVANGIRNDDYEDAHYSEMPAFGRDELLEPDQVDQVVNFVMSLSGEAQDTTKVAQGAAVFEESCAACHGSNASGDSDFGAPNLSDAIWLYGGDYATLTDTVNDARFGVMPGWSKRLTEAQVRAVSLYVHQLGGGE